MAPDHLGPHETTKDRHDHLPSSRRPLGARDLALVASFAALIAALTIPGAIPIGGFPAPITLQTLGVMLAGSILGWKRGALAVLLYLAMGAVGLPVFAGGKGGLGVVRRADLGLPVRLRPRGRRHRLARRAPAPGLPDVVGRARQRRRRHPRRVCRGHPRPRGRRRADLAAALKVGGLVFLPGDLVKVVIATVVAAAVHRAVPDVAGVASARARHRVERLLTYGDPDRGGQPSVRRP